MSTTLDKLSRDGKIMMLAYDQGFEHGPQDFNEQNYNPEYICKLAVEGEYTCMALQYSNARKFWLPNYSQVPLVVKLNGKTNLGPKHWSVANSTVEEALNIGASAVGYTIYVGSEYEPEMIKEFSAIRKEAHANGLAVFAWMYPFITGPSSNDDELEAHIVAYATRVGAELGADVVKIKYPHQPEALPWIIKNAVGCKAVLSGGDKVSDEDFTNKVRNFVNAGGAGIAVGRNAWQSENPGQVADELKQVIWG